MDDGFDVWLGRIGKERPLRHDMRRAINQAGGAKSAAASGRRRFSGARTGRGAVTGSLLGGSPGGHGRTTRRVIVKARFVKLAGKGAKAAAAHLRYLQRDGTTREGERGSLYGPETDVADGKAFLERGTGDRHQFRFIVAPENGQRYEDLKPVTRRLMDQMERDLGTRLEWVAVDHFNTGHPHTHIVVRGADDRGKSLIIARDYISQGIAARAAEIVNRDLGPRSEHEIAAANQREVEQERFTGIDRRILRDIDERGLAAAWHADPAEQALRAARLGTLSRMGLATEEGKGRYRLDPDMETSLRTMGKRGDIIATMHERLRAQPEVQLQDYAIYAPDKGQPIVGRVLDRGLSDEYGDRHYLIVDATDGRAHYVDIGREAAEGASKGNFVSIAPTPTALRKADALIIEVARASDGLYSTRDHLRYDPDAGTNFIQAHVRRLEALRRGGVQLTRRDDGRWHIGAEFETQMLQREEEHAKQRPVSVEVLADRPLEQMIGHEGATWLDHQCVANDREPLRGRIGGEIARALQARQQWHVEKGLAERDGDRLSYRPDTLAVLQQRELRTVAARLSGELGLNFAPVGGWQVEGTYRGQVQIGSEAFALIEKSHEFTLVPWRPVLERHLNQEVFGEIARGGSITWQIGRSRAGPEIGF